MHTPALYVFIFFVAVILVGVALSNLVKRARNKDLKGTPGPAVAREKPSADEPTPGNSVTAKTAQVENAVRKTPPA